MYTVHTRLLCERDVTQLNPCDLLMQMTQLSLRVCVCILVSRSALDSADRSQLFSHTEKKNIPLETSLQNLLYFFHLFFLFFSFNASFRSRKLCHHESHLRKGCGKSHGCPSSQQTSSLCTLSVTTASHHRPPIGPEIIPERTKERRKKKKNKKK